MGLDMAEISELAALRPVQTALSGAARATAVPGADNEAAAADTACVTPKASGAGSATPTAEGADQDDTGCVTPRATGSMLPMAPLQQDDVCPDVGFATPLVTVGVAVRRERDGGDEDSFTTPTTADSALVPATVCPPAPRKSAPAPTRKRAPLQQRLFYPVPSDLASVFVAVPQCPPPAKKMRTQVVESSVPLGT